MTKKGSKRNNLPDITGQKIGKLTVINGNKHICDCICECGKEFKAVRHALIKGHNKSCGCLIIRVNLTGSTFNFLTVIHDDLKLKVLCKCSCGVEKEINRHYLLSGNTKSCGCKTKEIRSKTNTMKFGVENTAQNKELQEKSKQTCLNRYGCEYSFQNEQVKEKSKQTCLNRYGVENSLQNKEIQTKAWNTKLNNPGKYMHSKVELEILTFVRQYYPLAKSSHTSKYQIDIWIEEIKLAIEYNGLYWHSNNPQSPKDKNYHLDKLNDIKAKKQGKTIFIWEHEWRDNKDQIKNFLLSAMRVNNTKIGARKCTFVEIPKKQAFDFLDDTHIQKHSNNSCYALGCFYRDELVAVCTFGKHHRDNKTIVLNRFACKDNYTISGCLSKFSKMGSEYFKNDIVSWADRTKSDGSGYINSGWEFEETLAPDYFYISKHDASKIISKQSRKKSNINTPNGMTESEHADRDGLLRVYDCGKLRFIYKYSVK